VKFKLGQYLERRVRASNYPRNRTTIVGQAFQPACLEKAYTAGWKACPTSL
jgi:hypothetical protein